MMFGRSTFRRQLVLTFLGFVLLAEIVVAGAILHQTYVQTVAQARASLEVGNRVLDKLMTLRSAQLPSIVDVLSSDFGFKSAVATQDGPTLHTVLANFGDRTQADLAIIAERDGRLTAAVPTLDGQDADHPFQELLSIARKQGDAAGMIVLGRRAYQFVVLPVRAPRLIAWVGMGFEVNHELAERLASLTGVSVDFVVSENGRQVFHTAAKRSGPTGAASNAAAQAQEPAFLSAHYVMLKSGPR